MPNCLPNGIEFSHKNRELRRKATAASDTTGYKRIANCIWRLGTVSVNGNVVGIMLEESLVPLMVNGRKSRRPLKCHKIVIEAGRSRRAQLTSSTVNGICSTGQ